ncbi:MAG: VWA domain-containing protein, partial [Pseudomonadota bacterium]
WSPGDDSWLTLAAEYWSNTHGRPLFAEVRPLLNVPLVITMWEPMAKALGYPGQSLGWKDLATLAGDPRGWSAVGRPEWGKFRWGHAHPDANSGFLTVISLVYAAAGKLDGLTNDDLKAPGVMGFLAAVEGAVEHYALSSTWIDDLMHSRGPAYLSAAVQYESTVIASNKKYRNLPFKLTAIYPKEGAFWSRHPAAVFTESWVTPEKQQAGKLFIDFLVSDAPQKRAMQMGFRPISRNVPLGPPFDDEHGVIPDVDTGMTLKVPGEGVLRRIRDLWESAKLPATIMVLLDRSGSMGAEPMQKAKDGAILFVKNMKPRDQLEVTVFNHQANVLAPRCLVKDCGESAVAKLSGVFSGGETALYDTISASYKSLLALQSKEPMRRYGLIVLTDGRDTHSKTNVNDFLDSLPKGEDFDAPKIFTIAYGPEADRSLLKQISGRTNARLFESNPQEIARTYRELSASF